MWRGKSQLTKSKQEDNNAWCIGDVKKAVVERKEFESGMNNDFAKWFFEDYLANNANQWQKRSQILKNIYKSVSKF